MNQLKRKSIISPDNFYLSSSMIKWSVCDISLFFFKIIILIVLSINDTDKTRSGLQVIAAGETVYMYYGI